MGNENETNYNNDPYIQQSQINNNQINNLYVQNSAIPFSHLNDDDGINADTLINQQKTIKTQAYKNPILLDKNSISLEKDPYNPTHLFITFSYSADRVINGNFYFNSAFNPNAENQIYYYPTTSFANNILNSTLQPGKNIKYEDKNIFIDIDYFMNKKIYQNNLTDVVIELYAFDINGNNLEFILSTFCKIYQQDKIYKIKPMYQKCKVHQTNWYDMEDIYGLTSEDQICEICCTNKRDTYFLPCRHSYTCKECAMMLRIRGNGCPICRKRKLKFYNIF
jgi:hypothetical protein